MPLTRIFTGIKHTFRALQYRNYRMFFAGQSISLIGMWIQNVAMGWLVYRLTGSATLLGVVGFAENIPIFLLTPLAGVLVDRWNRRRIFIITQLLFMVQAFLMSFLTLTGIIQIWHIILLSVVLGVITALDATTRQSFWLEMIENKEDLGNAIALNSTVYNSARLLGPALAGFVIAAVGEGICFLLNGISYIAVIIALMAMRLSQKVRELREANLIQGFKEGITYASGILPIRYTLLLLALISFIANPYLVLMPVFAKEVLGGGAVTLGYLVGCSGLGALIGAIFIASQKKNHRLADFIFGGAFISGLGFVVFSISKALWLSLISVFVISFGIMMIIAFCNILIQTIVDDDKRGRVMALHILALMGMTPFGNLLLGGLSSRISAPYTFMIVGVIVVLGAFAYRKKQQ
ncbi:MAG: MFS transporter [Deltaproteobacteria bacterium]|nr:MFS transporter [Deltaproteobacteria bacterium]